MRVVIAPDAQSVRAGAKIVAPAMCTIQWFDDDGNDVSHLFKGIVQSMDIRVHPDEAMTAQMTVFVNAVDIAGLEGIVRIEHPEADVNGLVDVTPVDEKSGFRRFERATPAQAPTS